MTKYGFNIREGETKEEAEERENQEREEMDNRRQKRDTKPARQGWKDTNF